MQPAQSTPLAELVKSLAGLHQAQHQALMDMKLEQEDRFRLSVQAQDEDRQAIRSLLGREENPVAAPSIAHVPLMRMGPHDDPEAFVDLFEKTAGSEPTASPPFSLRQSLAHPSAAGAAVRSGPACWRCGDPGHFQDHCPMMEVGLLVRVPDSPGAAPDQAP